MVRTTVVTGAASGIGAALCTHLRAAGHRVVGVDRPGTEVEVAADLSVPEGREAMVDAVADLCGGRVDAVVANAGVSAADPVTVRVCYFGAVATLDGLRPLLARGNAPRAATTCSVAMLGPVDDALVEACLAGDEATACDLPAASTLLAYGSAKRALGSWLRTSAVAPGWVDAGIALNAVAPGVVRTPMTAGLLASADGRALVDASVPMPMGGHAEPQDVAAALAWFVDPACRRTTGQVLFVDGGADAVLRGADVW